MFRTWARILVLINVIGLILINKFLNDEYDAFWGTKYG